MVIWAKEAAALETIVMPIYGPNFLFGRRAGSRLSLLSTAHCMRIRLVLSPRQIIHLQTPSMSVVLKALVYQKHSCTMHNSLTEPHF